MSGVAALFHRDGRPADGDAVWAMLAAAPYRGPDGLRLRQWPAAALGHAKMAVTPEEAVGQQPLVSERTGCAVTADVRLDNRAELLARLPGPLSPESSDAELILRAYEAWGEEVADHLLGDFAFVIWDPRQQRIVAARDATGQHSLFYRLDRRTFAAASEIHQLLQDPAVPVAPNEERLRDYLTPFNQVRNAPDHPDTFFQGISAVPAGHVLVVERGAERLRQYWDLWPRRELRYRRDEDYAEHFRALFFDVVAARMRTAGPVGALLSGGVDSTSVVCTAQELYRAGRVPDRGFTAFSLLFEGLDCDESVFIRDTQAKYGFAARAVPAAGLVASLQAAPGGFMPAPGKYVSELDAVYGAAHDAGVRVLLSGEVADSCTFGSRYVFDSLLRHCRFADFWLHLRTYHRLSNEPMRAVIDRYCLTPLLPLPLQRRLMLRRAWQEFQRGSPSLLPEWVADAMHADLCWRHWAQVSRHERERRFQSPARHAEHAALRPPEIGRTPAGWSVQVWRPYADRRVQEFLLAIPPEQKFAPHPYSDEHYAGGKLIVRRAMRGIMPESVRTRVLKTHFAPLFEQEVQRRWPDYEAAFGPGSRSEIAARGYVDPGLFWSRLERLRGGEWGLDFLYLLRFMGVETWLRTLQLPRPQLVTPPVTRPQAAPPLPSGAAGPVYAHA